MAVRIDPNSCLRYRLQKTMRLVTDSMGGPGAIPRASAVAYWSYHMGRSIFFMFQGALGALYLYLFVLACWRVDPLVITICFGP